MATVVVVGAGISGLSVAHYIAKIVPSRLVRKVVVLESSPHVGGWMRTTTYQDGCTFEYGPRSIRSAGKVGRNTLELVSDLGLADEVIGVSSKHPSSANRFIYLHKKIHKLPSSLLAAVQRHDPFSKSFLGHTWREPFVRRSGLQDESIHDFISRRISKEFAEYLLSAVCRGIYAGSTKELSMKSCFRQLFDYEQHYGSLAMGMLRAPKEKLSLENEFVREMVRRQWVVWSLRGGLQGIPQALQTSLQHMERVEIRRETACHRLTFQEGKVKVHTSSGTIEADHVISSCYAKDMASLVADQHPSLASGLEKIPAVHVAVVSLEVPGRGHTPKGFGHLVPVLEPSKLLGVIYESCIFEQHENKERDTTRLSVMMGGHWFEDVFGDVNQVTSDVLVDTALQGLHEQLGISQDPLRVVANLHKHCIPQYIVGHSQTVDAIDNYICDHSLPLSLVGSSYRGVSINDCIYNAKLSAQDLVTRLQATESNT